MKDMGMGMMFYGYVLPSSRKGVAELLEEKGITGAAQETFLRLDAPRRHDARVRNFTRELQEKILSLVGEERLEDSFIEVDEEPSSSTLDEFYVDAIAALVCYADMCGVGGPGGVSGDSTSRLPILQGITGSGRKQASDGGAWDAVIAEAFRRLRVKCPQEGRVYRLWFSDDGDNNIDWCFSSGDVGSASPDDWCLYDWLGERFPLSSIGIPLAWQRTMAWQGVIGDPQFLGDPGEWAEIFNHIDGLISSQE